MRIGVGGTGDAERGRVLSESWARVSGGELGMPQKHVSWSRVHCAGPDIQMSDNSYLLFDVSKAILSACRRYSLAAGYDLAAAQEGFLTDPPQQAAPSTPLASDTRAASAAAASPLQPSLCNRRRLRRQFSEACLPLPAEEARRDGVDSGAGFLAWRRAWGSFSEEIVVVGPPEPQGTKDSLSGQDI